MNEPYLIAQDKLPEDYISIHTSDRSIYRRCRRKWDWISALRQHLNPKVYNDKFFVGDAIHFALEDYHGYNVYGDPYKAFLAYHNAYKDYAVEHESEEVYADLYDDKVEFVQGLLDHYVNEWLPKRPIFKTVWINEKPMVEFEFSIYIPELSDYIGKPVLYQGKWDRVVTDQDGRIWIEDYKTAISFEKSDILQTNSQVSSYSWASQYVLNEPAYGMVFTQFKKDAPLEPRVLKNGDFSTAKDQKTTVKKFQTALSKRFGSVPQKYQEVLLALMEKETNNGDAFIRFDLVVRNKSSRENEYPKILMEGWEMLSETLQIYPNPTRDCDWDCDFRSPCLAMDDGSDYEYMLNTNYEIKREDENEWEKKLRAKMHSLV